MPILNTITAKSSIIKTSSLKGAISKTCFNPHPGQHIPDPFNHPSPLNHPHPSPLNGPNPFNRPNPYTTPTSYPTITHPNTHIPLKFSCKWNVHGSNGHGTGTITCKW